MNLSSVMKKSDDFVPQKLFPADDPKPPVWGDLAKQINTAETYSPPTVPSEPPSSSKSDKVDGSQETIDQFESDFSAPERGEDQIPQEELPEQQPAIDVEAIQEQFFALGLEEGLKRAEDDFGSSVNALHSICAQLSSLRETIFRNSLEEMQTLVINIAEKIIRHSVAEQKETILATVEEAILKAVKSEEFTISLNPADYDTIKENHEDLVNTISGLENIILKKNIEIEQGGCLLESSNCTVDATISSQLSIISDALKNA